MTKKASTLLDLLDIKYLTEHQPTRAASTLRIPLAPNLFFEMDDMFLISSGLINKAISLNKKLWLTENSVTLSETSIDDWGTIEIDNISFDTANELSASPSAQSIPINVGFIKTVSLRKKKAVETPSNPFDRMEVVLELTKAVPIMRAIDILWDFNLFLSVTKSVQHTPHAILMTSTRGAQFYVFIKDSSRVVTAIEEKQKLKHIKSTFSSRYAAWNTFNTIPLWPGQDDTVSVDFKMHYAICSEQISERIDLLTQRNETSVKAVDPITLFNNIFDLFELMLRSHYILVLPSENYGREEKNISALIKGFGRNYTPSKVKKPHLFIPIAIVSDGYTYTKKSNPTLDEDLDRAAYLRNRLHHTYLNNEPKKEEIIMLDDPMKMQKLAHTLWVATWAILAIDILKVDQRQIKK